MAVVGGSVTAGAGSYDTPRDAWVDRFERWLTDYYSGTGVNITVNNGAVPGESPGYTGLHWGIRLGDTCSWQLEFGNGSVHMRHAVQHVCMHTQHTQAPLAPTCVRASSGTCQRMLI